MAETLSGDPLVEPTDVSEALTPPVVICPHCARSLVFESGSLRLATAADTADLSDSERATLRQQQRAAVIPLQRNRTR